MISPLILAIAVSLDSFGVGLAYGLKKVRFPISAYIIIAILTTILMTLSMTIGTLLQTFISPRLAIILGGSLLIFIGIWEIITGWRNYLSSITTVNSPILGIRIPFLGIMIQILKDPATADFDNSQEINPKEAYALGLALGLDAFAAGFGASMANFSFILLPMVALFCAVFVALGTLIGKASINQWWQNRGFAIPGIILILVGLITIIL